MNKEKLNKIFEKDAFVFLGMLTFFVFVVLQGIKPAIDNTLSVRENVENAKVKLATLTEKEVILEKANQNQLASQLRNLDRSIPSVIDLPLILATLQSVAAQSEVTLGEFSISSNAAAVTILPVTQGQSVTSFGFTVALSGSFDNIERFVDNLNLVAPLIRIENLSFSKDFASALLHFYFQPKVVIKTAAVDVPMPILSQKHTEAIERTVRLSPAVTEEVNEASASVETKENPFR